MTFRTYAADAPRFVEPANRLLVEGQRTNGVRNPRCEGAAVGSPGTAPTNWSFSASANGITSQVAGIGVENDIPYVDFRFSGTASANYSMFVLPEATTAVVASQGQAWTGSMFVKLVAGTMVGTFNINVADRTSGGGSPGSSSTSYTPTGASLPSQRISHTRTLVDVTTARVSTNIGTTISNGVTADFTIRVGWPQLELGSFASSPILPVVASPAASTRGADLLSASLSSLGISASGVCTVLGTAMIPQNAPSGANQALVQIDDGSDNNRFMLRNFAGGATIVPAQAVAGVTTDGTSAGSMTAGTLFKWGVSIDGAGRMAVSVNGAAVSAVTGGPTGSFTTLRIGNNFSNTAPLFGEIGTVTTIARALSDAELVARVNALT